MNPRYFYESLDYNMFSPSRERSRGGRLKVL